jgi:hypothetical protein
MTHDPIKLFISYSHRDERLREQLQEHLHALKRRGLIEDWQDRRIAPGQEWEGAISENLESAGIILLLVSSSFIASPYCYNKEMTRALERHASGEARCIPVILRPAYWDDTPFARLQALPKNGRPVTRWSNRDEAWLDVAMGIRRAVEELRAEASDREPEAQKPPDTAEEHLRLPETGQTDVAEPPTWEYVDFELKVEEESEPRKYPVTVRSMEGEARAEMHFPFDEWDLRDRLRDLEIALLRSGGARRRSHTAEEQKVQEFGRILFEALLVGDVRSRYEASLREARKQDRGLRVKLYVQPPELSWLPWEFLYDPKRDYLVLSSMTPLVRYLDISHPVERLMVTAPLRILGLVASPQGLPQLDVGHEKRLVEEAVRGLRADGQVELSWLEGQTWRDLQRAMRRGPWHLLHFVGHGGFDSETEEGAIALSDEHGRKDMLGATRLARLVDDHYPLRLVFLNSCEGARGSERDAFSSTAATLVRRGVPAVVAMQYEVTDETAIEFSRDFYEAISDGLPVDAAVAEARTAVSMRSALEWATPVLYMRSSDGRIFDLRQAGDREGDPRQHADRKPSIQPDEPGPRPPTLPGW